MSDVRTRITMRPTTSRGLRTLAGALLLWLLSACHPAPPTAAPAADGDKDNDNDKEGVTLTSAQFAKLGIVVEPAEPLEHRDEAIGYGVVVNHDAIAQASADLITAKAARRLSASALARAQKLNGTPGAVSADVEETAAQKAEVDAAVLTATQQKLSSLFGMNPPWKNDTTGSTVQAIAGGRLKLLRVTFPSSSLPDEAPTMLRVSRIGSVKPGSNWETSGVWSAPSDSAVPGRSFFALLKTQDVSEGERVQVFAPVGEATRGVAVPAAAVVLSAGQYWCYVQRQPGVFVRAQIDISTPLPGGYFVREGIAAGDGIVTNAAGQLLAKELGGATEPD